tara:strand:- start:54710 stop:54919 length:210 start_codon:yes stop_codon:yes gene_type:complete
MHENSRLSVIFLARKNERDIEEMKIYARITVDGKRLEFSLNRNLKASLWDNNRKRGKGSSKYVLPLDQG